MTILDHLDSEIFGIMRYHARGEDPNLFTPDSHQGFELLHVCNGNGHFIINDHLYVLSPMSIFFINGRHFHYSHPENVGEYERNGIHIDSYSFTSMLETLGQQEFLEPFLMDASQHVCLYLPKDVHDDIDMMFEKIHREYSDKHTGYKLVIAGLVFQIMAQAFRNAPKTEYMTNSTVYRHVTYIMEYMKRNLDHFSLDNLANDMYLNKYYLCHIFKSITGLTIQSYLQKKRIEAAQTLLISTDLPISQIAMDLGYGSFSVFSRNFHHAVGSTPHEYRKILVHNN